MQVFNFPTGDVRERRCDSPNGQIPGKSQAMRWDGVDGVAEKLNTEAFRCDLLYEEKRVNLLFVKGQEEAVTGNCRMY